MLLFLAYNNLTASMWTRGITPLCSSGFVTDKIVFDQVMPQFELCCTVFTLQLSSLSELVGVTDPKQSVCFCCCFCQLALLFTLAFFKARHLATQFLTFSCLFFLIFFCLDKDRFCSLPSLDHGSLYSFHSDVCSNLYIYCKERASESLSLSFSGCECRERT